MSNDASRRVRETPVWRAGALSGRVRPDAVFCVNDIMALGVVDAARGELGLAVPADVAVPGSDDIPMAGWKAFRLSTVRQPVESPIDAPVAALSDLADGRSNGPGVTLFPYAFVRRATTRPTGDQFSGAGTIPFCRAISP